MFPKDTASFTWARFFTSLGRHMALIPAAIAEKINWMNQDTGVKTVLLRIETPNQGAEIELIIQHDDQKFRFRQNNRLLDLRQFFFEKIGPDWT